MLLKRTFEEPENGPAVAKKTCFSERRDTCNLQIPLKQAPPATRDSNQTQFYGQQHPAATPERDAVGHVELHRISTNDEALDEDVTRHIDNTPTR